MERQDSEARRPSRLATVGESHHGGTCDDRLGEMVRGGQVRVAPVAADAQCHRGHDDALSAQLAHHLLEPVPRILPHMDHQAGIARHLRVPRAPGARTGRHQGVVQAGYRDAQYDAGWHPAVHQQLREVRAGQLGGEWASQRRAAAAPHGRADRLERDGGGREVIARGLGDLQ